MKENCVTNVTLTVWEQEQPIRLNRPSWATTQVNWNTNNWNNSTPTKQVAAAEYKVQELDFNIFRKSLAETKRTLDDAQIRSPQGHANLHQRSGREHKSRKVRWLSCRTLSHFKIQCEIADTHGDRVAVGGRAIVKIEVPVWRNRVECYPLKERSNFIHVQLKDDKNSRLRSGLKGDVYVMNAVKENVL